MAVKDLLNKTLKKKTFEKAHILLSWTREEDLRRNGNLSHKEQRKTTMLSFLYNYMNNICYRNSNDSQNALASINYFVTCIVLAFRKKRTHFVTQAFVE